MQVRRDICQTGDWSGDCTTLITTDHGRISLLDVTVPRTRPSAVVVMFVSGTGIGVDLVDRDRAVQPGDRARDVGDRVVVRQQIVQGAGHRARLAAAGLLGPQPGARCSAGRTAGSPRGATHRSRNP